MKKILLALFVMCSALSFSAKVIKSTEMEVKGDIVYEIGQKLPYTGVLENYSENGIVTARAELGSELGIGYSNAKQFMAKLNRYGISLEEFKKAYEKIIKQTSLS